METLVAFLFAFCLTLFFVRRYVKKLSAKSGGGGTAAAATPTQTHACPRCNNPVVRGAAFCASCGAPMALWNLQRATQQTGSSGEPADKGRPRPVINATLCIGCGSCIDACPEKGTLELVSGKAILAHPERCMGHGDCVSACPTSGILLAFGDTLQTLRVPNINQVFESNVAGLYIVGELGGMGLIKTAINEGKLAIDDVRTRLEREGLWSAPEIEHNHDESTSSHAPTKSAVKLARNSPADTGVDDVIHDVLIVGAGPAGLSATLTAHQYGLKYVTLEQGEIAATIRNYPRHKFLMAEPLEMPLIGSLYISDSTKEGLLAVWETIVRNTGVAIRTNEKVEQLQRDGEVFMVRTAAGEYRARYVVLALGKRGSPRRLGVPGEDQNKVTYRLIEAESYSGEDILVIGGGDSAVEAALALGSHARNRVTLCYRGADFSRLKERNRQRLAAAEREKQVRVLRASTVEEILPDTVRLTFEGKSLMLPNRYVFVMIGGESPEDFLKKTGVEIVEKVLSA